jgi:hypothetical protein
MIRNGLVRGVLVLVAASGVLAATARAADEKDVIGTWKLSYSPGGGEDRVATLSVTKEGSGLKGKFVEEPDRKFEVTKIAFKDGKLTFSTRTVTDGEPSTATWEGRVKGDAIKGEASYEYQGGSGSLGFEGKREPAQPEG